jgi:hypothetical protein
MERHIFLSLLWESRHSIYIKFSFSAYYREVDLHCVVQWKAKALADLHLSYTSRDQQVMENLGSLRSTNLQTNQYLAETTRTWRSALGSFARNLLFALQLLGIVACLKFMWDIRHPKNE